MKKLLLPVAFLVMAASAMAQPCIPNPLYADSVFGVWPDTTDNFMPGILGIPYFQELNLIVPVAAQDINPTFPAVNIDSVVFNGISNLPPGLAVACASQTAAPCTYLPTILGCAVIQGTPTQLGTFEMTVDVTGYFSLFGNPIPYPISFSGYRITITDNTTGVLDLMGTGLAGVRNVPNPFSTRTSVEFQMARSAEVKLRVFDLLGEEVWSQRLQVKAGANKVNFDGGDLQEGIYLYKVETSKETFTGRMVLHR